MHSLERSNFLNYNKQFYWIFYHNIQQCHRRVWKILLHCTSRGHSLHYLFIFVVKIFEFLKHSESMARPKKSKMTSDVQCMRLFYITWLFNFYINIYV
jgi:hypothetical protein